MGWPGDGVDFLGMTDQDRDGSGLYAYTHSPIFFIKKT